VSILAVLRGSSRDIGEILISENADRENKNIAEVLRLCELRNITVREVSAEEISKGSSSSTHGGIVASVGERRMKSLDELLSFKEGFVFMLCGIEDPYNFGDAVRSFYAFGAQGMVLSPRNWLSAASITIRSSAGATELMDCAVCDDEEALVEACKKNGIKIVCACEKDSDSMHRADLSKPMLVIVGGEKRGIGASLLAKSDARIRIPYGRNFNRSLSASAAAAAIGYEITRQSRKSKHTKKPIRKGRG
jgi:23S rRNA (guanosine2251-2'-O)-methyltransferase